MVRFAFTVLRYMQHKAEAVRKEPGFSPEALETQLRLHFQTDHPHLLPAFNAAVNDKARNGSVELPELELLWKGPTIKVIRRGDAGESFLRVAGATELWSTRDWPLTRDDVFLAPEPVNDFYEGEWPHENSDDEDAAA